MAETSIAQRVGHGLGDEKARSFLSDGYLNRLYDVQGHLADQFGRNLFMMLALSGAFALLAEGAVPRISVVGLTIDDPERAAKIIPAVIAALFAQVVDYLMGLRLVERTIREVIRQRFPVMGQGDLDLIATLRDARSVEWFVKESATNRVLRAPVYHIGATMTVLAAFAPAAFELYAYWRSFQLFGAEDAVVWVSLAVTAVLLVSAIMIISAVHWSPLRSSGAVGSTVEANYSDPRSTGEPPSLQGRP